MRHTTRTLASAGLVATLCLLLPLASRAGESPGAVQRLQAWGHGRATIRQAQHLGKSMETLAGKQQRAGKGCLFLRATASGPDDAKRATVEKLTRQMRKMTARVDALAGSPGFAATKTGKKVEEAVVGTIQRAARLDFATVNLDGIEGSNWLGKALVLMAQVSVAGDQQARNEFYSSLANLTRALNALRRSK